MRRDRARMHVKGGPVKGRLLASTAGTGAGPVASSVRGAGRRKFGIRNTICLIAALVSLAAPVPVGDAQDKPAAARAVDVAAIEATEIEWQEKVSSIGIAEALQGVNISGSEAGTVAEILFDSGAAVKLDQPLVKL